MSAGKGYYYSMPSPYGLLFFTPSFEWYYGVPYPVAQMQPTLAQTQLDPSQIKISQHPPCATCAIAAAARFIPAPDFQFAPTMASDFAKSRIIGCEKPTLKLPADFKDLSLMTSPEPIIYGTRSSTFMERAFVFSVARIVADHQHTAFYCMQLGACAKDIRNALINVSREFDQRAFELLPQYLAKPANEADITFENLREFGIDDVIERIRGELEHGIALESLYVNASKDAQGRFRLAQPGALGSIKVPVAFVRPLRFKSEETPSRVWCEEYEPFLVAVIGDVAYAMYDSTMMNISYVHQKIVEEMFRSHDIKHLRCIITTDVCTRTTNTVHYF